MRILWEEQAWEDYLGWQMEDKKTLRKINRLIKDIQRNGYKCSYGKVEFLKGNYSSYASLRIDSKNRLVFYVNEKSVNIVTCKGHYDDH